MQTDTTAQAVEAAPELSADARNLAMLAHLVTLVGAALPLTNILVPLFIWKMHRAPSAFVDDHARESLNFQITFTLATLVLLPFTCFGVGIVLLIPIAIAALVFVVIASLAAHRGQPYRYPATLRFVK